MKNSRIKNECARIPTIAKESEKIEGSKMTRIGGFFLNVFHRDKQSQTLPKGPKHTEKHVLSHPRYFRPPFTPDNQPQL